MDTVGKECIRQEMIAHYNQGIHVQVIANTWSDRTIREIPEGFIATGSFGRGEASLSSDLDLICIDHLKTKDLDTFPKWFPELDKNGLGSPNAVLPETIEDWNLNVSQWVSSPLQDRAVVKIGLMADAQGVIRERAFKEVPGTPLVSEMLRDALSHQVPRLSGAFCRTSFGLKQDLMVPVIKLARWGALASGVSSRSTPSRLKVTEDVFLDPSMKESLVQVFNSLQDFRICLDIGLLDGIRLNRLGAIEVSTLDRKHRARIVEAAKTIRKIQKVLRYRLSTSSYAFL